MWSCVFPGNSVSHHQITRACNDQAVFAMSCISIAAGCLVKARALLVIRPYDFLQPDWEVLIRGHQGALYLDWLFTVSWCCSAPPGPARIDFSKLHHLCWQQQACCTGNNSLVVLFNPPFDKNSVFSCVSINLQFNKALYAKRLCKIHIFLFMPWAVQLFNSVSKISHAPLDWF